jgi:hypothetical protein
MTTPARTFLYRMLRAYHVNGATRADARGIPSLAPEHARSHPPVSSDQHRQELLRSSAAYATARLAFANAIVIAQRAGETDEEIARVTGYTSPMIRTVLRSS